MIKKPKNLTKKQWEVINLWNPWGKNLSQKQIAKKLEISQSAVSKYIKKFKKLYPDGYKTIMKQKQTERDLQNADSFGEKKHILTEKPVSDSYSERIREIF